MKKEEKIKFGWFDLIKSVWFILDDQKNKYVLWNVALIILLLYEVVPAFLLGKVVDFFTDYHGGNLNTFYFLAGLLGGSYVIVSFLRLTTKRHLSDIVAKTIYNVRVRGFEKLLTFSLTEHKDENTGAKAQKIENGTNAFQSINSMLKAEIYVALSTTIGVVFVFAFLSPLFIVFLLFYFLSAIMIVRLFNRKLQLLSYEKSIATEQASGSYIEGLGNILTIKSSGAEDTFKNSISAREELTKNFRLKMNKASINLWQSHQALNGTSLGIFLFLIGWQVIRGEISVGEIIIFYSYIQQLIRGTNGVVDVYSNFIDAKATFGRMMPIFFNETKNHNGSKDFPIDWQGIVLQAVNFVYKKDERDEFHTGINNLDLKIEQFEKIGFAGKTGSGKSTLAKLLIGLYSFDSGKYEINGLNFYDIKNEEVLKNMSLVLQESEMFNLTLKDNITLMREFNKELFQKAISISQLSDVIKKLPQGIETLIGEKGYYLSGGERQRVGIARAIYRDSQIMIFDEATSSLDHRTERFIHEALEKELQNKTLIFVAHRVSTLKNADKIYVFDRGRVVESGKYEELLNNQESLFYKLNTN